MLSDTRWEGLQQGLVDSRRVDHSGKWNFFWAVMPRDEPALALVLGTAPIPAPKLPTFRSLETGFAALPGGYTFYLRLKDINQLELFETLCRDVIECAEQAATEAEALVRAVGRTSRWHHLLRGGTSGGLSEQEQKGLIGELAALERLVGIAGCHPAITAWTGPMGSPKDFELHGHCIEVKTRRAAAQPYVQISNEFQLADVQDHRLWLGILSVDKVAGPFGNSLDFFVDRAASLFREGDPDVQLLWELAISATGYRVDDDYSGARWVPSNVAWYEVRDGFPRIDLPLHHGVGNLKYSISLAACEPFSVPVAEVEAALSYGYTGDSDE